MGRANEPKSGDALAGVAARSALERVAAKIVLSETTLAELHASPCVPYEDDAVTRLLWDELSRPVFEEVQHFTVGRLREHILDPAVGGDALLRLGRGLTSEMIAAVTKLMSNLDLIVAARKIRVVTRARTTLGLPGRLAVRVQPNHPADSLEGILAAVREGVSYGCGDAVIGVNPVVDDVARCRAILDATYGFIEEWCLPTQNCCLAHVTTQMRALERGAKLGLMFQSLCGTEQGLAAFGTSIPMLEEAWDMARKLAWTAGQNVMYFETGQGSALSADAHHGVDQLTCEARNHGVARHFQPFLVNTVVGFIGPEYLYDARQIARAALEDHFMGKLHGLPMGCDACYTNHADADPNDLESLEALLAAAGCSFFMGVPGGDDVMLAYQSTSYHDAAALRELHGLRPAPEMEVWLEAMGLMEHGHLTPRAGDPSVFAAWRRGAPEPPRRVEPPRARSVRPEPPLPTDASGALTLPAGRDLGVAAPADPEEIARLSAAHEGRIAVGRAGTRYRTRTLLALRADHAAARDAVLAEVDPAVIARLAPVEVQTRARDKQAYLMHPELGRALGEAGRALIAQGCLRRPELQLIYGDGLSAAAVNEHAAELHEALLEALAARKIRVGTPVFVRYARVKVMDEIARLVDADAALFICGERPGLGTADSLSAYAIYHPDRRATDAEREVISNIHPHGLPPAEGARQAAALVARILHEHVSGVAHRGAGQRDEPS